MTGYITTVPNHDTGEIMRVFVAPDGENVDTLWTHTDGEQDAIQPVAIARRIGTAPLVWDLILTNYGQSEWHEPVCGEYGRTINDSPVICGECADHVGPHDGTNVWGDVESWED